MFDFVPTGCEFLPFSQTAAYAAAARACGAHTDFVALGSGTALVLRRSGRQLVSRGPVWQPGIGVAEKRRALRRLARFAGVTLITPEEGIGGFGLIPLVTPMHHAIWDLSGDLRAGMTDKWGNRLRAAERAGERLTRGTKGVLERLIRLEAAQRRSRGYRALSPEFSRALPEQALRLWEWRYAGQTAAAMAFVVEAGSAAYHLSYASEVAKAQRIPTLMLTQAAMALREEGVRWLDLGSINSEETPGLARFKLGTGAVLKRLGPTLLVLPG